MKKIWKILAIAAAAATVIPYKVEEDLDTGEKTWDALLWQVRARRNHTTGKSELTAVSILPTRRIRNGEAAWFENEDDEVYACYPDSIRDIEESDEPSPF